MGKEQENMDKPKESYKFRYKEGDEVKLKKDKYFRNRGGTSRLLDIACSLCNEKILLYQKDGKGNLHRCYIDRIYDPYLFSELQDDSNIMSKKDMPVLKCPSCSEVVGYPMVYEREHRLAYSLIYGKWSSQKSNIIGI
ncbi:MAG: hypothetical protein ACYDBX_02640 [Patescibacteria group bacterium]